MNNYYKSSFFVHRISFMIGMISIILSLVGCSKMDHTYEHFWKDGEIVYPAPADSVKVYPGKNRIDLRWLILADPNVSRAKVSWNFGKDSLEIPIQATGKSDTIRARLSDMKEGSYVFSIFTFDGKGNRSIPVTTAGRVYGDSYTNSLLVRILKSAYYIGDSLVIVWGDPADPTSIGSDLVYKNTSGAVRHMEVGPYAVRTVIRDYDFNADPTFSYRTEYLPDSMAIDTFYTAYNKIKVKGPAIDLPKTGWIATASSFDTRPGASYRPASNTIDNNISTIWVNQISPQSYYPHTLTIDMGRIFKEVEGVSFIVQQKNETPKTVELLVSIDGVKWTTMGMYSLQNIANIVQYINFPEPQDARLFRVVAVAPTSTTNNIIIAEVGAFTR